MIHIDSLRIEKDDNADVMYVYIAKENNIFYVWTSQEEWEDQDFQLVKQTSNQYKSIKTASEVFEFYADSFSPPENNQ